ncbi:hypothetical protein GC176_07620 [bacterium]|nr:hypothetical protein [bacterium]
MSTILSKQQSTGPGDESRDTGSRRDLPPRSDNVRSLLDPTSVIVLNRLLNATRQAAMTTRLADGLCSDLDFKSWLHQLSELHDSAGTELRRLLETEDFVFHSQFSLWGSLRRLGMKCARRLLVASDFVLMDVCRRAEYRVQATYEVALWVLHPGTVREVVEDQFQQFVLHRSMIPARRLPQTNGFLQQAGRLQQIHSPQNHQETSHVSSH